MFLCGDGSLHTNSSLAHDWGGTRGLFHLRAEQVVQHVNRVSIPIADAQGQQSLLTAPGKHYLPRITPQVCTLKLNL